MAHIVLIGILSNEDGNVNNDGSEKIAFLVTLYFFVRVIWILGFYFFALEFVNRKIFLHEAKQY